MPNESNTKKMKTIYQTSFTGGMVSESVEALAVQERLQHVKDIINFEIDSNGLLQKRKGFDFSFSKDTNVLSSIDFGGDIVLSECISITKQNVFVRYFIKDAKNKVTTKKINFEFSSNGLKIVSISNE